MDRIRAAVVEVIGTFCLTFIGAGVMCLDAVLSARAQPGVGWLAVALASGLALAVMITNFGHVSGGHFNPAVTFGFFVTKRVDLAKLIAYWAAQLLGAALAALLVVGIFKGFANASAIGLPMFNSMEAPFIGPKRAIMIEAILTFFLVTAYFAAMVDERGLLKSVGGFGIGLTLAMCMLMGGPLTGASLNPARSFGPALVAMHWTNPHHLIYWIGPLLGGGFAAALYDVLFLRGRRPA
jgi:MIP family channel proteins